MTAKTLFRTIKNTFDRFLAIILIVGLGVGFYTGLKSSAPAMKATAQKYLTEQNQYDLQLISNLGLTEDDLEAFRACSEIKEAEGGFRTEAIADIEHDEEQRAFLFLSLPESISVPRLTAGSIPSSKNECAVDCEAFKETDIGKIIRVYETDAFTVKEFKIVGLVRSPRFISGDRGNASVGNGTLAGFIYLTDDAFNAETYHEIILKTNSREKYFTEEYARAIQEISERIKGILSERVESRYRSLYDEAAEPLEKAKRKIDEGVQAYNDAIAAGTPTDLLSDTKLKLDEAQAEYAQGVNKLSEIPKPAVYVFDNQSNIGYVSFQNDITIIDGISNAFPFFFALIAVLVCITTMTRMVNEERVQIGTLKALGYHTGIITLKYILYAGFAGLIGCILGFFLGTGVLPRIIWAVYGMSYGFAPLEYWFSPVMYVICLAVSVLGPSLVTWIVCRRDLKESSADLIRPKAPANGKPILIEKSRLIWNKLSFLNKIMLRNAFRYRQRTAMMLIGIAGCTALIVTGFGLKDSVANIVNYQYDKITVYDVKVQFDGDESAIESVLSENGAQGLFAYSDEVTVTAERNKKSAELIALPGDNVETVFRLRSNGNQIKTPGKGEIVLSEKLASKIEAGVGDVVSAVVNDEELALRITGICDNYIGHFVYISIDSVENVKKNVVYVTSENASELAVGLREVDGVEYVTLTQTERDVTAKTMSSMNYVVLVVIVCAGALSFIVLYNLTNINIIERSREVATVQVLGFRPEETSAYVLRENILLSVLGAGLGLAAGKLLHWYVMLQVQVDKLTFDVRIAPVSYLISFFITVVFAVLTNLFMRIKLARINMAESLKSVE